MLSSILAIGFLISGISSDLPRGNYAGRLSSPFLFVDCTFVPASGVSSVHMVVGCDEQKPAAVGRFDIEPVADQPDHFVIRNAQDPSYRSMIGELKRMCPRRAFTPGDFVWFGRVMGPETDDYRVFYDALRRSVLLTKLTTPISVQRSRAWISASYVLMWLNEEAAVIEHSSGDSMSFVRYPCGVHLWASML
ncbi:hypothetical protein FOZ60_014774 [Perkinsus olseni]|uniref:Uncharacterized protein n=1 Tax=Perkinsus olseni TaxID=32597 RepID=A0A7J6N6U9_PEROL|nr:hypothetical protein FOZ60_014774 [Perkinsus olseni]